MPRGKNYVNNNRGVFLQASTKRRSRNKHEHSIPVCQYGTGCTRPGCIYRHPHGRALVPEASDSNDFTVSDVPVEGSGGAGAVARNPQQSSEPCMAFLADMCSFTARGCRKRHPGKAESERLRAKYATVRCRFGEGCRTRGCLYVHPGDTSYNELHLSPLSRKNIPQNYQQNQSTPPMRLPQEHQHYQAMAHEHPLMHQMAQSMTMMLTPSAANTVMPSLPDEFPPLRSGVGGGRSGRDFGGVAAEPAYPPVAATSGWRDPPVGVPPSVSPRVSPRGLASLASEAAAMTRGVKQHLSGSSPGGWENGGQLQIRQHQHQQHSPGHTRSPTSPHPTFDRNLAGPGGNVISPKADLAAVSGKGNNVASYFWGYNGGGTVPERSDATVPKRSLGGELGVQDNDQESLFPGVGVRMGLVATNGDDLPSASSPPPPFPRQSFTPSSTVPVVTTAESVEGTNVNAREFVPGTRWT